MRRFVNGEEVELSASGVTVSRLPDRLLVRTEEGTHSAVAVRSGDSVLVSYRGRVYEVQQARPRARASAGAGSGEMHAPMPGLIVDVLVAEGDAVTKGQKLLVLEAMKTQQPFLAPFDGKVAVLAAGKGQQVIEGSLLIRVEAL